MERVRAAHGLGRRRLVGATLWTGGILVGCGGTGGVTIPPFELESGLVVTDLDGDGRCDVAVATTYIADDPPHPGFVDVYRQTASGVFAAPVRQAVGADPWGLVAGDLDGDGRLDLLASSPDARDASTRVGGVSVLRQDPTQPGAFLAPTWVPSGGIARAAALARPSALALPDLVVADAREVDHRALWLARDPFEPGAFEPAVALDVGGTHGVADVVAGDLDGDGRTDVVLAATDAVVVLLRLAGGGFAPAVRWPAGSRTEGVAVADLDDDGRLDVVAANAGNAPAGGTGGSTVTVFLQTGPGHFERSDVVVADGARKVAIGDLDDDGALDLAVISVFYQSQAPSRVTVLLQSNGTPGAFAVAGTYAGPFNGNFVGVGDVDDDGFEDVVVNDGPSVLRQHPAQPGTFEPLRPLR